MFNKYFYFGCLLCLLMVFTPYVDGRIKPPHQFRMQQCGLCHSTTDDTNEAADFPQITSQTCISCHPDMMAHMTHPVEITPRQPLPPEMPLIKGRLTCLTCHFVHPKSLYKKPRPRCRGLLRNNAMGSQFCMTCHGR